MKKFCLIPLLAALAIFVSCQKQQTEEERKAEVERQVQDRLAAERADAEKKRVADESAALDAREKAVAEREAANAQAVDTPVPEQETPASEDVTESRDTQPEERSTESYGMFYEKLDPYGEWRETSDYGYVWQPREAETTRDWRPYTEGRWAYSDAGWTWISDEPFGWATYHYGRWVRLRRVGWVWVPGHEWGPAWVSWRTSKDYVGWAPLPPEARFDRRSGIHNWADNYYDIGPDQYAFVSSNDFGAEHIRRSVVPAERNISIAIETTNVTRITFSKTMIMNEGPSYEELRSRGPRQIERYRLRRDRNTEAQARVRGDELEVSVPVLSTVRNVFKPRRVKERVVDVNVDNGWTEIKDRSAAERARTKFRTEATPPPNAPPKKFVKPVETATSSTTPATPATPAAPAASRTPATASPTPAVATASPTPAVASPRPSKARTSPSPTIAAASPTPATAAASATPAASASPRVRPSNTPRSRPSAPISSSPTAPPSITATPAATVAASPSVAATSTPAASAAPSTKARPSPSIPPRPVQTPTIQRRTPPSLPSASPVTTPAPATTPEIATTPVVKATVTVPPVRRPSLTPRPPMPAITPADASSETARPSIPHDAPRRTMPPRMTPPPTNPITTPAATTTPASSVPPPAATERPNNRRRPLPPVPGATPAASPSSTPG